MWRPTNWATPGYSFFCHDTTASGKNKVFSVCGHSCGQSHFYAVFGNRWKSHKCRCHKAFRRFALLRPGYRHGTPKCGALPTGLHPDIQFLSLYHGGEENQRFFCLWSFMWSKPLLCRFRQSGKVPQTQALQGFAAFRLVPSRIPPRHSQSRRATNCATPGYFVIYPAGRVPPKQLRCTRRRIPPKQLRCTLTGASLLYHNAGKMQVGMARKMRAFGNL